MTNRLKLSRRRFAITTASIGGGMAVGFYLPGASPPLAFAQATGTELSAWVVITPDNTITIRVGRAEIGQGVINATIQFVAEELDADWSKIKTEFALESVHLKSNLVYGRRSVAGSNMVYQENVRLRQVGAQTRAMLVKAAAQRWGVPESDLVTENSVITHTPTGFEWGYAGSGPLQLALAILADCCDDATALNLHHSFKWTIITELRPDGFVLSEAEVRHWVADQMRAT